MAEKSSRGTYILVGLIGGVFLVGAGVFAAFIVFCFGVTWIHMPGDEIASVDVEAGVPFTLSTPTSHETARSVWLEFVVDYEILDKTDPWALEGWVEIDGVEFEIDLQPGSEGIKGYPDTWEEEIEVEEWHVWSEVSGNLLLGSIPPVAEEGSERKVDGQVWGLPGTEVVALRVYALE